MAWERSGGTAGWPEVPLDLDEKRYWLHVARHLGVPFYLLRHLPAEWVTVGRLEVEIAAQEHLAAWQQMADSR